jgi:hypothetical protein
MIEEENAEEKKHKGSSGAVKKIHDTECAVAKECIAKGFNHRCHGVDD